ncbi:MAG: hypothetical protein KKI09_07500 [Spirochaetes bacterium]|nr:hypothetical protein [Spirochaetota bacterium]MBU0955257.1 hypothetical protein [Spirochaetota bacterium]
MKLSTRATLVLVLLGLLLLPLLLGCTSTPPSAEVVQDLSAAEMIQRAQELSDLNDWAGASAWYQATLVKFADDLDVSTMCRYELAFVSYKQGRYSEAETQFRALLNDYNGPDGAYMPPRFYTLAQKVLETIAGK